MVEVPARVGARVAERRVLGVGVRQIVTLQSEHTPTS